MSQSGCVRVGFLLSSLVALATSSWAGVNPAAGSAFSGRISVEQAVGKPAKDSGMVVVYLNPLGSKPAKPPVAGKFSVASRAKIYVPEVQIIPVGSEVDFPNDDSILHNTFSLSKAKPFDLGLYGKGGTKSVTFDRPGIVRLYCNIHQKMQAFLAVVETPYFALTDSSGEFTIPELPAGEYEIGVWHRYGGGFDKKLTVSNADPASRRFEAKVVEEGRLIQHGNKFGQEYPDKY